MILKRIFDIVFSLIGLIVLLPLLILIAFLILIDSELPVLFLQDRVGIHNKTFKIIKFRTMKVNSEKLGQLTIGDKDPRVTRIGYFLRKYKLDELPQLVNVLNNTMSFVGPRPELRKYVDFFPKDYSLILTIKPGITDLASIAYRNEAQLLKQTNDPDSYYLNEILPKKLNLHKEYIAKRNLLMDLKIIFKTFIAILK